MDPNQSPKGLQEGDLPDKITMSKVGRFLKSTWSKGLSEKRTDDKTKYHRTVSCHGDPNIGIESPCEWRRRSEANDDIFYCGACGCGDKPRTWLNGPDGQYTKLDYPDVVCPLQMPGFNNHELYGQETEDGAKEKVTHRKLNIEFTIFGNPIVPARPNTEQVNNPQVKQGHECKKCGRNTPPKKPCRGCGNGNEIDVSTPPTITNQERVKNTIDDVPLG